MLVTSWILIKNKFLVYVPLQGFLLTHFIIAQSQLPSLSEDCCCSRTERLAVSWNKTNAFVNPTCGCRATSNNQSFMVRFGQSLFREWQSYLNRCGMLFLSICCRKIWSYYGNYCNCTVEFRAKESSIKTVNQFKHTWWHSWWILTASAAVLFSPRPPLPQLLLFSLPTLCLPPPPPFHPFRFYSTDL